MSEFYAKIVTPDNEFADRYVTLYTDKDITSEEVDKLKRDLLSGAFVPALASNLFSPTDLNQNSQSFIKRTTGGSDSVRSGEAILKKLYCNSVVPTPTAEILTNQIIEQVSFNVSVNSGYSITDSISVTKNSGDNYAFVNLVTTESSVKTLSELNAIGIIINGNMQDNDSFNITYNGENYIISYEFITSRLSLALNSQTFRLYMESKVSPGESTIVSFVHNGVNWTINSSVVSLVDYGITVSGNPINGDNIIINYKRVDYGTIQFSTPTKFKAIGFNSCNCFDPNKMVLDGYTINSSGNIVPQQGSYVCWAEAVYNQDNSAGYAIYDSNHTIVRVGFNTTIPTATTTGINLSGATLNNELSHVTFNQNGYICVAVTNINGLCIHPSWSGYMDKTYSAYSESVIDIPTTDESGSVLSGQFYSVGTNRNYFDFQNRKLHKVVTRIAYTEAALASLIAQHPSWVTGVHYVHDNNWIYHIQNESVINLPASTQSIYVCNDFSIEKFEGTNVAPIADFVYGQNLVDKLRTDVLTKNDFTLTINASSTDAQVPTAKSVYTLVGSINNVLEQILG